MADFVLELSGEQFRRAYLLYVIEIRRNGDSLYYIGQTGDRNYTTARPAFRRLTGHFEDRDKSTQNQIYKYIAENLVQKDNNIKPERYNDKLKQAVEDFLTDSKVAMHIYKVLPFNPGVNPIDHRMNVNKTEQLERAVISSFSNSGRSIMNKAKFKSTELCPFPEIFERIKSDFHLQ